MTAGSRGLAAPGNAHGRNHFRVGLPLFGEGR